MSSVAQIDYPCSRAVLVAPRIGTENSYVGFGMLQAQLSAASVPNTGAQVAILLLSLFLAASQLFQVLLGDASGLPGWIDWGLTRLSSWPVRCCWKCSITRPCRVIKTCPGLKRESRLPWPGP